MQFEGVPEGVNLRDFGDTKSLRQNVYNGVLGAMSGLKPVVNKTHTLRLVAPKYIDPEDRKPSEIKKAILTRGTLGRRVEGTWELSDNVTGKVIDSRKQVVATVPHFSDFGTVIRAGTKYAVRNQQRLDPGVFARRKNNGELEAFINHLPGEGMPHRIGFDPDKNTFTINIAGSTAPLLPFLKAMKATDQDVDQHWGVEIGNANRSVKARDSVERLASKLLSREDLESPNVDKVAKLVEKYQSFKVNPFILGRTLGMNKQTLDKDVLLAATAKLIKINRGEAESDDRDSLEYQRFFGPEDLFAERIAKDSEGWQKKLLYKVAKAGSLSAMPSGALTHQLDHVLLRSGVAQPLEEINTSEFADRLHNVTRMGEGGISPGAIPLEARNVQNSHFGFLDVVKTPESGNAGIDLAAAMAARKGSDGRLYSQFVDTKTGKKIWRSPQDLAGKNIAFYNEINKPGDWVRGLRAGVSDYLKKDELDYVMPYGSRNFSPLSNTVPWQSSDKGQRNSMGARMYMQALSLKEREAPHMQLADEETGEAFEKTLGHRFGAIAAEKPGKVMKISDEEITVQHADGTTTVKPYYQNLPFNRKSLLNQQPVVKVGDQVQPGQLLAESNYTDRTGTMAMGVNAYAAYVPWKGLNHNDAVVISESLAKRTTSEHAYQHELEVDPKTKQGRQAFSDLFPGRFTRDQMAHIDDDGVVKVGTKVTKGQPLIVAAKQKAENPNRLLRRKSDSWSDSSVEWDHDHDGEVVDVQRGKKGPVVVVRSFHPTVAADKLSGRFGDKGVIAKILPDAQMPHDKEGRPFEILLSPNGLISRTNAAQAHELGLGKVARKVGRPYLVKDFDDTVDHDAFVSDELKKHGMSLEEGIIDPETGREIPGIATGTRFMMKLHHTAECYDDKTEVLTSIGWVPWPAVHDGHLLATVDKGRLTYEKPLELVRSRYTGHLLSFASRYVDYAVTGNHRMWVKRYFKDNFEFRYARDVHGSRFQVQQFGFKPDKGVKRSHIQLAGHKIAWKDYCELTAWWVTEGYAKVTKRRACVMIYQSKTANPEKFAKIEALLNRLPFPWHYYKVGEQFFGFGISSRELAAYYKKHGTYSHNKRLPRDVIDGSLEGRLAAIEVMIDGDGNRQDTKTGPHERYTSTSSGLADDFQELCIRAGSGAVVRADGTKKNPDYLPSWTCGVALSRTLAQVDGDRNKDSFSEVPYDGYVYCATMRTGLLYVRRNGKPMLCGNSKGQARSSGSYNQDDEPAKGGYAGCFAEKTNVVTEFGKMHIGTIVKKRMKCDVPTTVRLGDRKVLAYRPITDWMEYHAPRYMAVVVFEDGSVIECTTGHEFYCYDQKIAAISLLPGQEVSTDGAYSTHTETRASGLTAAAALRLASLHSRTEQALQLTGSRRTKRSKSSSGVATIDTEGVLRGAARNRGTCPRGHVRPRATLKVKSVTLRFKIPGEMVYDFTVDDGSSYFLSNGVHVSNSKRVSLLDVNAILAHGGYETLRDAGLIRGQRNDTYWMNYMRGYKPNDPVTTTVYQKFLGQLRAAGIDPVPDGKRTHFLAMTNKSVDDLAEGRVLKNAETVKANELLDPIAGGLFDPELTGGHGGMKWSKIPLTVPLVNPVMEDPVKRVLGLTQQKFEDVLSGKEQLNGKTGPQAIAKALDDFDLDSEIAKAKQTFHTGAKTRRDEAVRKLFYLVDTKRVGMHPRDWLLNAAPVMPPAYRRISTLGGSGMPMVADANPLYKELFHANETIKEFQKELGDDYIGDEHLNLYNSLKAVTGLGDPITKKSKERKVRGVLQHIFGTNPKMGTVQRRLIGSAVDQVGRSVVIPNPDFNMDQIGIPKKLAMDVYKKEIVRNMVRQGRTVVNAMESIHRQDDDATRSLLAVMEQKPIQMNRAPVLHKLGYMAFKPKLVAGDAVQVPTLVLKGFNMDFDGDASQFHVPATDEAVKEAYERMLPSRHLISPTDRKTPVAAPSQEYLGGLYEKSTQKSGRAARTFRNIQDVLTALKAGTLDPHDEVEILDDEAKR